MMENHEYLQISLGIGAQLLMPQWLRCFHANLAAVCLLGWAAGLFGVFRGAIFDRRTVEELRELDVHVVAVPVFVAWEQGQIVAGY